MRSSQLAFRLANASRRPTPWSMRASSHGPMRTLHSSQRRCEEASTSTPGAQEPRAAVADDILDIDATSHDMPGPSEEQITAYAGRLKRRKIIPSRYHYRSPRYYRGPLHPHQPPPKTSPASREYVPGPFSLPRLMQTHQSIVESDLMTLFYQHIPPGTVIPEPAPRLRQWDESSPYYKNRPLRAPRGRPALPLMRKMITFRNVPTMKKINISCLLTEGAKSSEPTHVIGMLLQVIANKRATIHEAKKASVAGQRTTFTQKKGKPIAASVQLEGEQMWHFLSTFLTVVLPKIKEWPGVKARSGDRSGNYGFCIRPEIVGLWPEVAVNFDTYPVHMIPELDIRLETTAATDRDGRILLSALGVPFISGGSR